MDLGPVMETHTKVFFSYSMVNVFVQVYIKICMGMSGWLSGLSIQFLIFAQIMTSGF